MVILLLFVLESCGTVLLYMHVCADYENYESHTTLWLGVIIKWGRTGAVVSVADNGPRGPWFETWPGSPFVVALSMSHLLPDYAPAGLLKLFNFQSPAQSPALPPPGG